MIRPLTCLCALLAANSGLYLYQTKHRTLVLDHQIAATLQQADIARARTATLQADYQMLTQPDRLTTLSARYLALKPQAPSQWVQLADLDQHLPPVQDFTATPALAEPEPQPALTLAEPPLPDLAAPLHVAANQLPVHAASPARPGHAARTQYAALPASPGAVPGIGVRAEPMPMAAPRIVGSSVLATAALRPIGQPIGRDGRMAYPRIGDAELYASARPGTPASTSMLGGGGVAMAPPVPVR